MEHRRLRLIPAAGIALLAVGLAGWLVQLPSGVEAREAACHVETGMGAAPEEVVTGEEVTVRARFSTTCGQLTLPMHLVLVLDVSPGTDFEALRQFASRTVEMLDPDAFPGTRIGVVTIGYNAAVQCRLTNDVQGLAACIDAVDRPDIGPLRLDAGVEAGKGVLVRGREDSAPPEGVMEVMVVASDGQNSAGCPPFLQAANDAKMRGMLILTYCSAAGCDEQCLRQGASSPRYYFKAGVEGFPLGTVLSGFRDIMNHNGRGSATVTDTLPDGVTMVPGSADAPISVQEGRWTWDLDRFPVDGMTLTFRVTIDPPGRIPLSSGATFRGVMPFGEVVTATFPIPEVLIRQPPTVTPEPTETPAPGSTINLPRLLND